MEGSYHNPVLLTESVDGMVYDKDGVYVDLTFGGGGHSREILKRLDKGKLIAFDQDDDTKRNIHDLEQSSFTFFETNFRYFNQFLKYEEIKNVNGVLADLGVSSHQFDTAERGFSTRFESELDMRMNQDAQLSAFEVVNEYDQDKLADVLYFFGEIRNARQVAAEIVRLRSISPIKTVNELKDATMRFTNKAKEHKFFAQLFQAIRIEVNEELEALKEMLEASLESLASGGKLVIISYHSLEDRLVKNFMKTGNIEGKINKDLYGKVETPFKILTRKPIVPNEEELRENSRSRSAKLRIAEKI